MTSVNRPDADKKNVADRIAKAALLRGTFMLRSGLTTNIYFDKYRFESDPVLLNDLAMLMAPLVPANTQILAGLELGGIPIVTALSRVTGLPAVFVRKVAKTYGTLKAVEGTDVAGLNALVVEDVITTGGQVIASTEVLRGAGAMVDSVLCAIWRGTDLSQLNAIDLKILHAFTGSEIGS